MANFFQQFGPNTALLDARGTAQILHNLSLRFTAVEFADFCTVAEEIVLRDQIMLVGKLQKLPRHLYLALKPLLDAGVFVPVTEPFSVPELPTDPRQLRATKMAIERGLTSATLEDAAFEAARLMGGEARYGVVATPLLRQLQHFGLVRRPCVENTIWDLAAQYRVLSEAATNSRRRLQSCANLPQISVPPIALRAIQRSKTFEQATQAVLELRDEFGALRAAQREIEERMREGRLSPREALDLQTAWRERWERMVQKIGSAGRMAMAQTSIPLLKEGIRIVKSITSQDVTDVVAATIGWIGPGVDALGALQLRPIHRSVSNYLSTSDRELLRAVARIFETDFVRLDSDMKALAYQPDNPWRLASDITALPSQAISAPTPLSRTTTDWTTGAGPLPSRLGTRPAVARRQI